MKWFLILMVTLTAISCSYKEVKRETGYKGKARLNPWLAAERFCGEYEGDVRSLATWTEPTFSDAVWILPAALVSNQSFAQTLESWVSDGGHLIILVNHAAAETNDWIPFFNESTPQPAMVDLLVRAGIELDYHEGHGKKFKVESIDFEGENYRVSASSQASVQMGAEKPGVFASAPSGDGRITVLTDGSIFRNRYIGREDHASLLDALVLAQGYEGDIGFIRGSTLSLWKLLKENFWPAMLALLVLTIFWLWKNFNRFGPLEAVNPESPLKGYDHHLEALGNFQWRTDRGAGWHGILKARIMESAHRMSMRAGHEAADLPQFLADFAGLPRERVERALSIKTTLDPAQFTRATADLQHLLRSIN